MGRISYIPKNSVALNFLSRSRTVLPAARLLKREPVLWGLRSLVKAITARWQPGMKEVSLTVDFAPPAIAAALRARGIERLCLTLLGNPKLDRMIIRTLKYVLRLMATTSELSEVINLHARSFAFEGRHATQYYTDMAQVKISVAPENESSTYRSPGSGKTLVIKLEFWAEVDVKNKFDKSWGHQSYRGNRG